MLTFGSDFILVMERYDDSLIYSFVIDVSMFSGISMVNGAPYYAIKRVAGFIIYIIEKLGCYLQIVNT